MTGISFSREVSAGHIIQALALAGAVFVFAMRLESRQDVLEVRQDNLVQRLDRQEMHSSQQLSEIRKALLRIEDRLNKGD